MEIVTSVRIPIEELNDRLHYRLICEQMGSDRWRTGKVQRAFTVEFSYEEIVECKRIYKKAHRWYLKELPQEPVEMYMDEYKLWRKLKDFIVKHCTLYGGSR